jgi:Tfp pilus assembly protein PilV
VPPALIKILPHRCRQLLHGFSLLEVITATTLLAIALLALMEMLAVHMKETSRTQDHVLASAYAQAVLEETVGLGFRAHSIAAQQSNLQRGVDNQVSELNITTTVIVTEVDPNQAPTYKVVEVFVDWKDQQINRQVALRSYVTWQN